MASVDFTSGTTITSAWLNSIDALVYDVLAGAATVAAARTALGLGTADSPTLAGLTLSTTPLAVTGGGTGSGTASGARTNLGLGALAILNTVGSTQIDAQSVTYAKIQNISATDKVLGRSTAGAGVTEEIACTSAGRDLLDDVNNTAQRTTLGLGGLAVLSTVGSGEITGSAVTYAKIQNVSATDKVLGRSTAGAGVVEEIACTSAGRALIDDADAAAQRVTLAIVTSNTPAALAASAAVGTGIQAARDDHAHQYQLESFAIACSDETTALTSGTGKVFWRMPYAFTVTDVRASLTTAQATGGLLTVDVNESGTTIISTKLTFDNTEKTTQTAATARVISDTALADDAEMSVDIDSLGDGTAKGLKVYIIGRKSS